MPSKLKGMCASGRPAIATAEHGTQIAKVVQKCGIVVQPGDVTALASAIVYLATNPEKCTQLGKAARKYAVNHWNQEKVLGQVEQKMVELSSPKPESVGVNAENLNVEAAMLELSLKSHGTEFSRDRSE